MSFSKEVKEELIEVRLRREDDGAKLVCGAVLAAASLKYSQKLRLWGLNLVSENEACIDLIAKLARRSYGLENQISLNVHERLNARNTELFLYGDGLDRLCFESGLMSVDESGERSYETHMPDGLENEHSLRAFIRGVFLMCGSVADPNKGCHAELVLKNELTAKEITRLLSEKGIPPKLARRRNMFVVYIKNGETVEDFLTFMGAGESMLRVSESRMIRDAANNVNRELNCFSANLEKTAKASVSQIEDIDLIVSTVGFDALSDDLYEIARERLDNPELSLTQLADKLGIGRSAANYRLKKIAKIASELRTEKK
ncbi:MAG: DNA-binding protein WhiA [Clostridiales bacterium]|nr:DNA-binding protein WhiA [Clostridiales bacterium]